MLIFIDPSVYNVIFTTNMLSHIICAENSVVVNYNSMLQGIPRIDALNPFCVYQNSVNFTFINEEQFEQLFSNVMTTPEAFKTTVDMMREVYNGKDVFVLCDFSSYINDYMVNCLSAFILQTYGYVSNIVKDIEDCNILKDYGFTPQGLQTLDANFETYKNIFGIRDLYSDHGVLA